MSGKIFFCGIAGGSGAGKSTLSNCLQNKLGDFVSVVHFDDYQRKELAPICEGMTNWDDPRSIAFDALLEDLSELAQGRSVAVDTMNERENPDFAKTKKRLPIKIFSRPIIILEGYLAFHDVRVRNFLDYLVFLDAPQKIRMQRRGKFMSEQYIKKILIPMHNQYIEPTKQYATEILAVKRYTPIELCNHVLAKLPVVGVY